MKVMVMGDMNDDPTNKSMKDVLRAKADANSVNEGDMYNPWYNILVKQGTGTLSYQGSWNLFDQIVLTPNMVNKSGKRDFSTLKYWKTRYSAVIISSIPKGVTRVLPSVRMQAGYGLTASATTFP